MTITNKIIILDDNELSIMKYAEEYPENWKKICDALSERKADKFLEKLKREEKK